MKKKNSLKIFFCKIRNPPPLISSVIKKKWKTVEKKSVRKWKEKMDAGKVRREKRKEKFLWFSIKQKSKN